MDASKRQKKRGGPEVPRLSTCQDHTAAYNVLMIAFSWALRMRGVFPEEFFGRKLKAGLESS